MSFGFKAHYTRIYDVMGSVVIIKSGTYFSHLHSMVSYVETRSFICNILDKTLLNIITKNIDFQVIHIII